MRPHDQLDWQLIALLRLDNQLSVADLVHTFLDWRATVTNPLRKLENTLVIVGCMVVQSESQTERIRACMSVTVEGNPALLVISTCSANPAWPH